MFIHKNICYYLRSIINYFTGVYFCTGFVQLQLETIPTNHILYNLTQAKVKNTQRSIKPVNISIQIHLTQVGKITI